MKIKTVSVQNFLGIIKAELSLRAPVTLICGPNESGKSSLQEAIRLAVLGQALRVEKRGEFDRMIHGTAKRAVISMEIEQGGAEETLNVTLVPSRTSGVPTEKNVPLAHLAVFDTEHLTSLDSTALKRALFSLSAVDMSIASIEGMAAHMGLDALTIEEVRPFLKAGFQQAVIEARSRSSEGRLIWKSITNEAYGAQKAEQWAPQLPVSPVGDNLKEMEEQYQGLGKKVAELEVRIEQDGSAAQRTAEWQADIVAKEAELAGISDQSADITNLEAELASIAATEGDVRRALEATKPRQAEDMPHQPCPSCGTALAVKGGKIVEWQEGDSGGDADAHAAARHELETLEKARLSAVKALERARGRQRRRDTLTGTLQALRANPPVQQAGFNRDEAVATRDALVAEQVGLQGRIAERRAVENARRAVETKVAEAARAHRDVERWVKCEEVYGPDGVPSKILGRALGPLNAALRHSAELAGWPPIEISQTIEIIYRDLPLALASESGKWRARAMLVHALAELHAVQTVILDRMDVLHVPDRAGFLQWAQAVHKEKGIQFLVFATMREAPKLAGVDAYWLERGKLAKVVGNAE